MPEILFPYGKEKLSYNISTENFSGLLTSSLNDIIPDITEASIVKEAMEHPIGSKKLCDLAVGKKNIVIIASDHTRPVPSKIIIPLMLDEIRLKNPDADITILIATGCHRGTTKEELIQKFGSEIVKKEKIYIHDCDDTAMLVNIGTLPSGGECIINKLAENADLLVAEGFIEPHFFAGFSGGRKSVLPGIAGRKTVLANHCSEFIADENARTGITDNNPIHNDMLWAARKAGLTFIVNVIINAEKKIVYAVSGDLEEAHKKGRDFLIEKSCVNAIPSDVVISTNGGYPLDQNIYQAVKGMTAAETTVKRNGVIIMLAKSNDGTGGDFFYHQLADNPDIAKTMDSLMMHNRSETLPDQWEVQILIRILLYAHVIYVSEVSDDIITKLHMIPAHSLKEAVEKAKEITGRENISITAIPDGVSIIVKK